MSPFHNRCCVKSEGFVLVLLVEQICVFRWFPLNCLKLQPLALPVWQPELSKAGGSRPPCWAVTESWSGLQTLNCLLVKLLKAVAGWYQGDRN